MCEVEIWVGCEFHLDHHSDWIDLITLIFGGHLEKQSKVKVSENGSAVLRSITCFMQCTLKIIFYFFKALDHRRKEFLIHTKQYDIII